MDISGDQQRVAAQVRHRADAANEVTDRAGGGPAFGGAKVIRLPAEPGIIAFFLGFLFQIEAASGGAALR